MHVDKWKGIQGFIPGLIALSALRLYRIHK
jgi:hypothetical protein